MISIDKHDFWYFSGIMLIVVGIVICIIGLLLNFGFFNPDYVNSGIGAIFIGIGLFTFGVGVVMHYIGSMGISERESK